MHISINFSSNYYKYIYSSDIRKYYYIDKPFKDEQNDLIFKLKKFN